MKIKKGLYSYIGKDGIEYHIIRCTDKTWRFQYYNDHLDTWVWLEKFKTKRECYNYYKDLYGLECNK